MGTLAGCHAGQPWHGFLDTDRETWGQYLDQKICIAVTNEPLAEFLNGPSFPNFNCIVSGGAGAESRRFQGDDPFAVSAEDKPEQILVTFAAKDISRREILWRVAKRYALEMTIAKEHSGNPACVLISPETNQAEQRAAPLPSSPQAGPSEGAH